MNNNSLKKIAILAFVAILSACDGLNPISSSIDTSSISSTEASTVSINIVSVNDLHGAIMEDTDFVGISRVETVINGIEDGDSLDNTILVANGDMFQGTAISNLSYGKTVLSAMNAMDFDVMGIGNHEFDWGLGRIQSFVDNDNNNGEATFPISSCNISYASDYSDPNKAGQKVEWLDPYVIVEREGVKVGIISAIGVAQKGSILVSKAVDYTFDDLESSIEEYAIELRTNQDCDIVIANIHDGGSTKSTVNNSALSSLRGNALIDGVINGHTHSTYGGTINRSGVTPLPVVQGGKNGNSVGLITLEYDKTNNEVISSSGRYIRIDKTYSKDVAVEENVQQSYAELDEQIEEVYGISGEELSEKSDVKDWMTNVMCKAVGADVGITNLGGIRTVAIENGAQVILGSIFNIMPFENEIVLCRMTGYDIKNNAIGVNDSTSTTTFSSIYDLVNENYYYVAVIDYLAEQFPDTFYNTNADGALIAQTSTEIMLREAMISDIKACCSGGATWTPSSNPSASLAQLYFPLA